MFDKLKDAIALVVNLHGNRIVSKTKLVKTLFLLEREYFHTYHRSLLNTTFVNYLFGPYINVFEEVLATMEQEGCINVDIVKDGTGDSFFSITLNFMPSYDGLTKEEKDFIVSYITDYSISSMSLDDILEQVYATSEYVETPLGENIKFK